MATDSTDNPALGTSTDRPEPRIIQSVLYVGSFGPPSLAFARSCAARSIRMFLLECGPPSGGRSSCICGCANLPVEEVQRPGGLQRILDYARRVHADSIVALSERHIRWLAAERHFIEPHFKLLLPSLESLNLLRTKEGQIDLAKQSGLAVLPTHLLRSAGDVASIPAEDYPVCLRPSDAEGVHPSFKVEICSLPSELRARIAGLQIQQPLIAQPFKILPNLLVHMARSESGAILRQSAFLVDRKFEGLALRLRRTDLSPALAAKLADYSRRANLIGPFHFDLLYDPGRNEEIFLEVNPRLGGTTDKVLWFGHDEAALCFDAYGFVLPPSLRSFSARRSTVVNKRTIVKHLLYCLSSRLGPLDYPDCGAFHSALASLRDLVLARDSVWDWKDWRGSVAFHFSGTNLSPPQQVGGTEASV